MDSTTPPPADFSRRYKWVLHSEGAAILLNRWNLGTEDSGLLSLDSSKAFNRVNRTVIVETWTKIIPEALPFVQTMYAKTYKSLRLVQIAPRPAASL